MGGRRRLAATACILALAAAVGCKKAASDCVPPPQPLVCPEAGSPDFASEVFPKVFLPVCDNCHAPGEVESNMPLTNYQQIYGPTSGPNAGVEIGEIYTWVFEECRMPPSDAPVPLDDDQRQLLLDWFACGAPDSASLTADAGTGD